jgi:CRISPR/Cas system-associated endonuclease Cas1
MSCIFFDAAELANVLALLTSYMRGDQTEEAEYFAKHLATYSKTNVAAFKARYEDRAEEYAKPRGLRPYTAREILAARRELQSVSISQAQGTLQLLDYNASEGNKKGLAYYRALAEIFKGALKYEQRVRDYIPRDLSND